MIVIVDYGVGNLASMGNMFRKIGTAATISSDEQTILAADKLILPGVGAFDTCAEKLRDSGLIRALDRAALEKRTPILGVCVGMQLLMEGSEEGVRPGLGWIKGRVIRFRQERMPKGLKIPHMGWTDIHVNRSSPLFRDMYAEPRFYFVHSYHPDPADRGDVLVEADYGYRFTAGMEHENIRGVQFHPEKSHKFGMQLLANFMNHC